MRATKNIGLLLLGIYLILSGILPLLRIASGGIGYVLPILAIVVGILLVLGR